jgi:hypothetical protein
VAPGPKLSAKTWIGCGPARLIESFTCLRLGSKLRIFASTSWSTARTLAGRAPASQEISPDLSPEPGEVHYGLDLTVLDIAKAAVWGAARLSAGLRLYPVCDQRDDAIDAVGKAEVAGVDPIDEAVGDVADADQEDAAYGGMANEWGDKMG